ncbi:hypothetical protein K438DRAFT_1952217 [Mycena galopus ATCC 62051]|nr:hypothetical protein K438DRAFT_1952217 [Mycena galopus ATCC 62051]
MKRIVSTEFETSRQKKNKERRGNNMEIAEEVQGEIENGRVDVENYEVKCPMRKNENTERMKTKGIITHLNAIATALGPTATLPASAVRCTPKGAAGASKNQERSKKRENEEEMNGRTRGEQRQHTVGTPTSKRHGAKVFQGKNLARKFPRMLLLALRSRKVQNIFESQTATVAKPLPHPLWRKLDIGQNQKGMSWLCKDTRHERREMSETPGENALVRRNPERPQEKRR